MSCVVLESGSCKGLIVHYIRPGQANAYSDLDAHLRMLYDSMLHKLHPSGAFFM
jgi:hypothetical protein